MSQHGFSSLAAAARDGGDLTVVLEAIQSGHIGTTRPIYAEKGMIWSRDIPGSNLVEIYFCYTDDDDALIGTVDTTDGSFSGAGGSAYTVDIIATGTWTKPASIADSQAVYIELWGAGGGGASDNNGTDADGGGGGGYIARWVTGADLGTTEAAIIGGGGSGGTGSGGNGADGGDTVFAGLTATGGKGGEDNATAVAYGGTPNGMPYTAGLWDGGRGATAAGNVVSSVTFGGAGGAAGHLSSGGNSGPPSAFGGNGGASNSDGAVPGGGGGGGDIAFGGGAGAGGMIRITAY